MGARIPNPRTYDKVAEQMRVTAVAQSTPEHAARFREVAAGYIEKGRDQAPATPRRSPMPLGSGPGHASTRQGDKTEMKIDDPAEFQTMAKKLRWIAGTSANTERSEDLRHLAEEYDLMARSAEWALELLAREQVVRTRWRG